MKRFLVAILFVLSFSARLSGLELEDLRHRPITQQELVEVIQDFYVQDRLDEIDRWKRVFPASFTNVDFTMAYYELGRDLYDRNLYMIALPPLLKGFNQFEDSPYKTDCAFYIAKIMYRRNERENALYYINRVIERIDPHHYLYEEALRLKRRIRWQYISKYEGMPDDSICDIEFDGDDVWIGMWSGGIGRYTRSDNTVALFRVANGLISPYVRDICIVGNYVWVGTYDGLCKYNKRTSQWERLDHRLGRSVVKRVELLDYRMFVATLGMGLWYQDVRTGEFLSYFDVSKNVTDFIEINGTLFIATLDKGLFRSDNTEVKNAIPGVPIKTMILFDGKLWIGTYGQGIIVVDPSTLEVVGRFNRSTGLSSNFVEAFQIVRNRILIGTLGGGVTIYNSITKSFKYLNILDGLPSQDVVAIAIEGQRIWFGTLSGGVGILVTENFEDI